MNTPSRPASPLIPALILGGMCVILSVFCCAVVAFAALALPGGAHAVTLPTNATASPKITEFPSWLPDRDSLPTGLKMVEEMRTSNQWIADQHDNPEEYLQKLEAFGRVEGFSREYGSADPCRTRGTRYVKMSLILHRDSAGAQRYMEWMEAKDHAAENFKKISVGDYGYEFWDSPSIEECTPAPDEHLAMVFFRRGNVIAFVEVSAAQKTNSDGDILAIAEQVAQTIDKRISGK